MEFDLRTLIQFLPEQIICSMLSLTFFFSRQLFLFISPKQFLGRNSHIKDDYLMKHIWELNSWIMKAQRPINKICFLNRFWCQLGQQELDFVICQTQVFTI